VQPKYENPLSPLKLKFPKAVPHVDVLFMLVNLVSPWAVPLPIKTGSMAIMAAGISGARRTNPAHIWKYEKPPAIIKPLDYFP